VQVAVRGAVVNFRNDFSTILLPLGVSAVAFNKYINFDVHVTVHRDKFLIIKPTRCTNFSILFWNESLHVSGGSSVHHQEFFTVHTTVVYVIQVC